MSRFTEILQERLLVCDGAMGTMLHAAGNSLDLALPQLNLSQPDLVSTVHESYVGAGVDMILTNTFGASRPRLREHGLEGKVAEINQTGVHLARQVARSAGRQVFVGGSIAPAVTANQRSRVPTDERADAVREQVLALADGGVDVFVLETFGYLDELLEAVSIAVELTDLPIVAQATFTGEGYTPGGQTPREIATALSAFTIAAVGANCTVGPQRMLAIVEELRRHTPLPISAQPNAGLPRRVPGQRFEYSLNHDYFARYASRCAAAGAQLVGGCCGTTPAHMREVAAALASRKTLTTSRSKPQAQAVQSQDDFAESLRQRKFVVGAEIALPAGRGADEATPIAEGLRRQGIDVILVPAMHGRRAQLSSASLALDLQQRVGSNTIATLTTWDKTIMSLQADALGAHAFGSRTVVCETGNPELLGDYPNADGIWEVDSVGLIELLTRLNGGIDCNGISLAFNTSFHIGARINPGSSDIDAEIGTARRKIAAGAHFLVTRPIYALQGLRQIVTGLGAERVPILATVAVLKGFAEAEYLAYEVPDVSIPKAVLTRLQAAGTRAPAAAAQLAAELLTEARTLADGVVVVVTGNDPVAAQRLLALAASGIDTMPTV
jgi:methionine synthase I (cobalamin-dependent)/5,10-methylenetetrahydrofolate reductase